jgi:hypothetical protein
MKIRSNNFFTNNINYLPKIHGTLKNTSCSVIPQSLDVFQSFIDVDKASILFSFLKIQISSTDKDYQPTKLLDISPIC